MNDCPRRYTQKQKPAEAGFYVNQVKLTDKSALYPMQSSTRSGGIRVVAHNVSHSVSHLKCTIRRDQMPRAGDASTLGVHMHSDP